MAHVLNCSATVAGKAPKPAEPHRFFINGTPTQASWLYDLIASAAGVRPICIVDHSRSTLRDIDTWIMRPSVDLFGSHRNRSISMIRYVGIVQMAAHST